jgi:hypothetical protein
MVRREAWGLPDPASVTGDELRLSLTPQIGYISCRRVAGRKMLSRSELLTTDTELSAMATAAHMGSSLLPQIG